MVENLKMKEETQGKEEQKGDPLLITSEPNSDLTRAAHGFLANCQAKLQLVFQASFEKAEIASQCAKEFDQIK